MTKRSSKKSFCGCSRKQKGKGQWSDFIKALPPNALNNVKVPLLARRIVGTIPDQKKLFPFDNTESLVGQQLLTAGSGIKKRGRGGFSGLFGEKTYVTARDIQQGKKKGKGRK